MRLVNCERNDFLKIIDFHTHPFICSKYSYCKYDINETAEMIPEELRAIGITRICGSVAYEKPDGEDTFDFIKILNTQALEIRDRVGDFYIPGIHIHPDYVKESVEEIGKYSSAGVKLIGELVPYLHDWQDKRNSSAFYEILEEAAARDMIVSIHNTDADVMDKLAEDNPNVTFVIAHPGEPSEVKRHIGRMKKNERVYLDLSGAGFERYGMLKYAVDAVGAERILFGSDYPICNPAMYVAAVEFEKITDAQRELIYYKNAERLLGL